MVRRYFKIRDFEDNPYRVMNIGLAIFFILMAGYILNNFKISSFCSLGLFTFYYYQNISMKALIKRMSLIGFFLYISFVLGILSTNLSWTSPLVVAFVSFVSRLIFRLTKNTRPGAIFVAMLCAMGSSMKLPIAVIPKLSIYFLIGVLISVIIGVITKILEKRKEIESFDDHLLKRFKEDPLSLMDAFFFSVSLFLTVYLSHSLHFKNPYWMTISCASVLAAENLDALKHRHIQYLVGSTLGLIIASILLSLRLPVVVVIALIAFLYVAVQHFIARNYAIAQMFINPMVIMLSTLIRNSGGASIIGARLLGIVCGSFLGLIIAGIMNYAIAEHNEILKNQYK